LLSNKATEEGGLTPVNEGNAIRRQKDRNYIVDYYGVQYHMGVEND
jgi:hypothetical protein